MCEFGENSHLTLEHERDFPKITCSMPYPVRKFADTLVFEGDKVTGASYLQMPQERLFIQLLVDESDDFIFQQDGSPRHWSFALSHFLNETLPQRMIGDCRLVSSPLTITHDDDDLFLRGYVIRIRTANAAERGRT